MAQQRRNSVSSDSHSGDESNDKSYKKSPEYKDKDNSDSEPNSSNADTSAPKKRKRVARACMSCQKSHMSCGDERPCNRCVDRGIGHLCCDGERKPRPSSASAPKRAKIEEPSFRSKSFADSARMYYTMNGSPMLPFAPQPMSNPPAHFTSAHPPQLATHQPNPYAQAYYWSEHQSQSTDYGYHQANNAAVENGDMSLQAPMAYMRPDPYARSRSMPGFGSHDAPVYSQNGPVPPSAEHHQYAPIHYASTYHTPSDVSVSHTAADEASYNQSYSSPADLSDAPEEHHQHYDNQYYAQGHYARQMAPRSVSPAPSGYSLPDASVSSLDAAAFAPVRRHQSSYSEPQTKYYKQSAYVHDSELGLHAGYVAPVATTSYSSHEWQGNSMLESTLQAPSY